LDKSAITEMLSWENIVSQFEKDIVAELNNLN
jgi:hypothetical protein